MQAFTRGYLTGVCMFAAFFVINYAVVSEWRRAKRMEDMQKAIANFARVQQLLIIDEEDPADGSGSDRTSSSASNLSRADVKGDDI